MSSLLIGLVGALVATNQPAAVSNLVEKHTGVSMQVADPNDPVEQELRKLMADDDDAQAEVDKWIRDNSAFAAQGAGVPKAELNLRIHKRFESVRKGYEDFLSRHTNHVDARVAYASFLGDIGDEEGALNLLEKAREINPKDPAVWNNLANIYGHIGPVIKAFDYYAKAIELNPNEPVYYHNYGTTVYLFRKDAMEHFHITEQQVFDKALDLYLKAMKFAPEDFLLAADVAKTYYGIRPPRTEESLRSWTNAFKLARDDIEREGVHVHFARIKLHVGRFAEAHAHLGAITNEMYDDLKKRLTRSLIEEEAKVAETNAAPASTSPKDAKTGSVKESK